MDAGQTQLIKNRSALAYTHSLLSQGDQLSDGRTHFDIDITPFYGHLTKTIES